MISKTAVAHYLNRQLDDLATYKVDPNITKLLDELNPQPYFYTPPFEHQKVCFVVCLAYPGLFVQLDMGLGKTKLMFDVFGYRHQLKQAKRMLILCNTVSVVASTKNEVQTHAPGLVDLIDIMTYQAFLRRVTQPMLVAPKPGRVPKQKKEWVVVPEKLAKQSAMYDFVVFDESTQLKNHQSLTFKVCKQIAAAAPFKYVLSGTPLNKNPQDLWTQFNVIDGGETLGRTLGIYRAAFFTTKINFWCGYEHTFKRDMLPKLSRMLRHRSIRYTAKECLDLPERIYSKVIVPLAEGMDVYYKRMVAEIREAKGDALVVGNMFLKMRQLCSGFLTTTDDGEKVLVDLDENPKLDAMLERLDIIPPDKKVVIFQEYIHTGDLIAACMKKRKIQYARLYSGTKDKAAELNRFNRNQACRVMIVNNQSGALGLNLQVANYVFFYESPVSSITRLQAEARCHRAGQTENVFYYDFMIEDSIEEEILKSLVNGGDFLKELLDGRKSI